MKRLKVVEKPHPRLDYPETVTGCATYAVDVVLPSILHARLFRSSVPRAKIRRLDASRALSGVAAVLAHVLANAVAGATGVRIKDLPTSAEKLLGHTNQSKER